MIHFVGAQYRNAYRACIRTISAWQLLLRDSVCMCAKVYLYHFRDLCITYGNKRSFLCTYFFLAVMITSASFCACENFLFTLKKHDWKILVFLFSGFSSSVGYCMFTASGVLLHSDLLFYTLQFQNCHHTKITNCLITLHLAKKINCHHDSLIYKIANV